MITLDDTVQQIVNDWVQQGTLFTALDVSNEVKKTMPLERHRTIRDVVRSLYSDMQRFGYGRTPIPVVLPNGDQVEALLYHPLTDSWDLDTKYDAQKRAQTAATPLASITTPNAANATTATTATPFPGGVATITVQPAAPTPPVAPPDPNQVWDQLFDDVDLFPIF
jgi:hypothetical protein